MAQANAQIGVAKSAYYPNLMLSATGGFRNSSVDGLVYLAQPVSGLWDRLWPKPIFDAGCGSDHAAVSRHVRSDGGNYRQTVLTSFSKSKTIWPH